jgi:phospholipid/cholesterol/gamma-HCH transport system substrate-binding protein
VIGVVIIIGALLLAVALPRYSFDLETTEFAAEFSNAAGITSDAQVYIAGVAAGRVTDVALDGDAVKVTFRLDNGQQLGDRSSAAIELKTVLGNRYLASTPAGNGVLPAGATIPVARTTVPFDVGTLAQDAVNAAGSLNTDDLQRMVSTLDANLPHDPTLIGDALQGVSGVSQLLAQHDAQIQQLLTGARSAAALLVGQRGNLSQLLGNLDAVAQFLLQQRTAIDNLLGTVSQLSTELNQLIGANKAQVGPLLTNLTALATGLHNHEQLLGDTLTTMAPALNYLANSTGNGPWLDVAGPAVLLPDNVLCAIQLVPGCKQ